MLSVAVNDAVEVMVFLVSYSVPCAFVINLGVWGVNVLLGAMTGKGFKL